MNQALLGQPVVRTEDARFLTGRGRFVADLVLPGMVHAVFVRSTHAHAVIRSVATDAARHDPAVLAVLTAADVAAAGLGTIPPLTAPAPWGGADAFFAARSLLATERVRHVGDAIAMVVAETEAAALAAAELVEVDYEPLAAVVDPVAAGSETAPRIWPAAAGNVGFRRSYGDADAARRAIAGAPHTVTLRTTANRVTANSLEPRCAVGLHEGFAGRSTLYTSSQAPHRVRTQLALDVFRIPESSLRVVAPDVGGGFGMKGACYPEEALVLWAARLLERPVKWVGQRGECLASDAHGRDCWWEARLGFDGDGQLLGLEVKGLFALGAYVATTGSVPPDIAAALVTGPYGIGAAHVTVSALYTNTAPVGPYRGSGQPEAAHLIERLLDLAAARLNLDRAEIRRRNLIPADAMPFRSPLAFVYQDCDFPAVLARALSVADWAGAAGRRLAARERGRRRGIGIACFVEVAGILGERVDVRFMPAGDVLILAGTHSHGQGHETVYAQMAADWLGVPMDRIRVLHGDTDQVAFGRGTYASRSMVVAGSALRAATEAVIERGRLIAAHMLEATGAEIDFADGWFAVRGTNRKIAIADVARRSYERAGLPAGLGIGLEGRGEFVPQSLNFPNGCHVCEVELDPETGASEIVRYVAVDDAGRVLNPLLLDGQLHGGIAQGIGQALFEQIAYDGHSGQLLSGSFMDYCMPRAADLPPFDTLAFERPATGNPLGVKGVGEAGCVGAPAALVGAFVDALADLDVEDLAMPLTAERIWRAICKAPDRR